MRERATTETELTVEIADDMRMRDPVWFRVIAAVDVSGVTTALLHVTLPALAIHIPQPGLVHHGILHPVGPLAHPQRPPVMEGMCCI